MMAPKGKGDDGDGLLEYLEDIIGSNKFVEQANEALKIVDELTDVRNTQLNRVKGLEGEKENLVGAKKEAEGFMRVEKEMRGRKNLLLQVSFFFFTLIFYLTTRSLTLFSLPFYSTCR